MLSKAGVSTDDRGLRVGGCLPSDRDTSDLYILVLDKAEYCSNQSLFNLLIEDENGGSLSGRGDYVLEGHEAECTGRGI